MLERLDPAELGEDIASVGVRAVAGLPDEGSGAGAPQQLEDLGARVVAMKRRAAHIAVARAGEQRDHAFHPARQPNRHALARPDAARREIRRQHVHDGGQRPIAEAPEAIAQGEFLRRATRVVAHERIDRVVAPVARGIVALDQLGAQQCQDGVGHRFGDHTGQGGRRVKERSCRAGFMVSIAWENTLRSGPPFPPLQGTPMSKLDTLLDELVTANRILAREEVVDSFGHISVRHPDRPDRFFLSRARAPDCIEREDIMEFTLDGNPVDAGGRQPYLERFIHGATYELRPDVQSVVHNHSPSVIPFGVTGTTIRPLLHTCGCMGHEVPIWDSGDKFGDTNMLVSSIEMGRDLARRLGQNRAALLRGHGSVVTAKAIREVVYISVYLEVNARLQIQAMGMGKIKFLTAGEVDQILASTGAVAFDRAWENWCRRAGRPVGAMTGV